MTRFVDLTTHELMRAGEVGLQRQIESLAQGRKPRFPERYPGELYANHILGAQAEMAVAKCLGRYWSFHANQFSSGDVGSLEVRLSQRHDLKIRPRDLGPVVSVSGTGPRFFMHGYMIAEDAREMFEPKSPVPGQPAYFVPREYLKPLGELIEWPSRKP